METQNRIKTFDLPHKGLRNALSQLLILAGKTDYTAASQVEQLYQKAKDAFTLLTVHAHDEDNGSLKHLEAHSPGASQLNLKEHRQIEVQQKQLEDMLENIAGQHKSGNNVAQEGNRFYFALASFIAQYFTHMAGEETETQNLLWQHFTDEQLMQHRAEVMGGLAPEHMMLWIKYVVPAQSAPERVMFMAGVKKMAPAPFFDSVTQMLEKELTPEECQTLFSSL